MSLKTKNFGMRDIQNEISIHSKLNHPNIIKLIGNFKTEDDVYLVLEYAEKGSFHDFLVKRKKLSEREALSYFLQIIDAVEYLHKNKILHRDIKVFR